MASIIEAHAGVLPGHLFIPLLSVGTLGYLLWKPKDESDTTHMHEHNFWAIEEEAALVRKAVNEAGFPRMRSMLTLLTGDGASGGRGKGVECTEVEGAQSERERG